MQSRKPYGKGVMNIEFILALLASLADTAKEDYASLASGAYYSVATRADYEVAVVADLQHLHLAHDCSRAIAMHNGGYYAEFSDRTVAVLKSKGLYSQDIHNCLAMYCAQNSH